MKFYTIKVGRLGRRLLLCHSYNGEPPTDEIIFLAISAAYINDEFLPMKYHRFFAWIFAWFYVRFSLCYEVLDEQQNYKDEFTKPVFQLKSANDWVSFPFVSFILVRGKDKKLICEYRPIAREELEAVADTF
jgi:hypothetical protein